MPTSLGLELRGVEPTWASLQLAAGTGKGIRKGCGGVDSKDWDEAESFTELEGFDTEDKDGRGTSSESESDNGSDICTGCRYCPREILPGGQFSVSRLVVLASMADMASAGSNPREELRDWSRVGWRSLDSAGLDGTF